MASRRACASGYEADPRNGLAVCFTSHPVGWWTDYALDFFIPCFRHASRLMFQAATLDASTRCWSARFCGLQHDGPEHTKGGDNNKKHENAG